MKTEEIEVEEIKKEMIIILSNIKLSQFKFVIDELNDLNNKVEKHDKFFKNLGDSFRDIFTKDPLKIINNIIDDLFDGWNSKDKKGKYKYSDNLKKEILDTIRSFAPKKEEIEKETNEKIKSSNWLDNFIENFIKSLNRG